MYRTIFRTLFPPALLLCGSGCSEISYPPPPQRTFVATPVRAVLEMRGDLPVQPWATIVCDVSPAARGTDWRWTARHPEFEFRLKNEGRWRAVARLTSVSKVLDAVHVQAIGFLVNGQAVGTATIDHSGSFDLSFPVPTDVFRAAAPVTLALNIDRCLTAGTGQYCVLLHSIGFVQDPG